MLGPGGRTFVTPLRYTNCSFLCASTSPECGPLSGNWNHGKATVRNALHGGLSEENLQYPGFPVEVCATTSGLAYRTLCPYLCLSLCTGIRFVAAMKTGARFVGFEQPDHHPK